MLFETVHDETIRITFVYSNFFYESCGNQRKLMSSEKDAHGIFILSDAWDEGYFINDVYLIRKASSALYGLQRMDSKAD